MRTPQDINRVANARRVMAELDTERVPTVGVIGVTCGAETNTAVVRKTPWGPLYRAVCNRWHGHDGPHVMTRGKDFAKLHTWTDAQCRTRSAVDLRRQELAVAARLNRV